MKDFKVSYTTKDDDLCHVRVSAYNKEDAKAEAKQEYWDIDEIIQVTPM
jgi:hypothetical protein